jgi:hypothetical protein
LYAVVAKNDGQNYPPVYYSSGTGLKHASELMEESGGKDWSTAKKELGFFYLSLDNSVPYLDLEIHPRFLQLNLDFSVALWQKNYPRHLCLIGHLLLMFPSSYSFLILYETLKS